MLERAVATGRAPTLQLLIERGQSSTTASPRSRRSRRCARRRSPPARGPAEHEIPAMNWWHRGEERYVEYGTSFGASRAFGIRQSLTDTIYNMNLEHLSRDVKTVFERLDDAEIRTAGHDVPDVPRPPPPRAVGRHGAHAARAHGLRACRPGARRSSSTPTCSRRARRRAARSSGCRACATSTPGCVAEYLVEHDLFDFLLLSLPDNDTHSHKYGPFAQVDSIAAADRQIARMMEPAGGPEKFLEDHAVIVCSRPLAVQGRGRDRPLPRLRRLRRARRPARRRRTTRSRSARTPAPRRSTCSTATAGAR